MEVKLFKSPMTMIIRCNAFKKIEVSDIDVSTLRFYGCTEGYDHKDPKSYNTIGFVVENAQWVCDQLKDEQFNLNREYTKPEEWVWVKDKFDDYETDKRPRLCFKIQNGLRGMTNPPAFELRA